MEAQDIRKAREAREAREGGPGSERRGLQILLKMLMLPEDQGRVLSKRPQWRDL